MMTSLIPGLKLAEGDIFPVKLPPPTANYKEAEQQFIEIAQGCQIIDFMITPLQFGYYSSEPKVRR